MLTLLSVGASPIQVTDLHDLAAQLHDALWIDVFNPSLEEERAVEQALGCDIPTKLEMEEIEASSRLHTEGSALIMTAMVLCNGDERDPESSPVTFILASGKLVTVRYNDPLVLRAFRARVAEGRECPQASDKALALLIDAFVDRLADILESVGFQVDKISRAVFSSPAFNSLNGNSIASSKDFRLVLLSLGRVSDLLGKVRESLVSFGRLNAFWADAYEAPLGDADALHHAKTVSRDISSLTDHATFLASKISFLLDATLGLINVEQNSIIKVFSVLAVIFLPPTLIGTIYGMNFAHMPELQSPYGYPIVLLVMFLSAVVPYQVFKRKGWF